MTCVAPQGGLRPGCPGLWSDAHEAQWARIVRFVHEYSQAKICMQLGHSGRKGSTQVGWERADHPLVNGEANWPLVSASPLPWQDGVSQVPAELDCEGMQAVVDQFVQATERAAPAAFHMI